MVSWLRSRKLLVKKGLSWQDSWQRLFSGVVLFQQTERRASFYKGKCEALDHGNVMKLLERVLDSSIREMGNIDETQFGLVTALWRYHWRHLRLCQSQEKYMLTNYSTLPSSTSRKPSIVYQGLFYCGTYRGEKWAVHVIQGIYSNTQIRVRFNDHCSETFDVGNGVNQGTILSQPTVLHPGAGSIYAWVPHWCAVETTFCYLGEVTSCVSAGAVTKLSIGGWMFCAPIPTGIHKLHH